MRIFPFSIAGFLTSAFIALVPVASHPASKPAPDTRPDLGQCYRLRVGLWSEFNSWSDTPLPLVVRFDSVKVQGSPGQGVISPSLNTDNGRNVGIWTRFGADSVSFGWHSTRYPLELNIRGRISNDRITGIAYSIDGTGPGIPKVAGVSARRIECPPYLRGY